MYTVNTLNFMSFLVDLHRIQRVNLCVKTKVFLSLATCRQILNHLSRFKTITPPLSRYVLHAVLVTCDVFLSANISPLS